MLRTSLIKRLRRRGICVFGPSSSAPIPSRDSSSDGEDAHEQSSFIHGNGDGTSLESSVLLTSEEEDEMETVADMMVKVMQSPTNNLDESWKKLQSARLAARTENLQDFELERTAYSVGYILARNASSSLYSVNPFKNRQMRMLWSYLAFIISSQLLALVSITVLMPATVWEETFFVDCGNSSFVDRIVQAGVLSESSQCERVGSFAFEAQVGDSLVSYRRVSASIYFYENTLGQSTGTSCAMLLLQLCCCVWVWAELYHADFLAVDGMLQFRDFNKWFIASKGEKPSNPIAVLLPLIYYVVSLSISCVSVCVICGLTTSFEVLTNALAFTFISDVGAIFNLELTTYYSSTIVDTDNPEYFGMYYIVVDSKNDANYFHRKSGRKLGDLETWYILEEDKKVGLITDFHIRHDPSLYPHSSDTLRTILKHLFMICPIICLSLCYFCIGVNSWKRLHP